MGFAIPEHIDMILGRIRRAGFRALPVGGCVRDLLRGYEPHDWDIASSADPDELLSVLEGLRIAPASAGGIKHGTVTVIVDHRPVEITSFRCDGSYSDGRRPDSVRFSRSLQDDLARRDFTINALCIGEDGGIIDLFGGLGDLERGVIRAIGDPDERFFEDSLRILRAVRFAASLGFEIEEQTLQSMLRNLGRLELLASERISAELTKLLCAPDFLRASLRYKEVLCAVLPELAPMVGLYQRPDYHCYDVYDHTVHAVAAAPADPLLRLTMLLHDVGKPICASGGHFFGHDKAGAQAAQDILTRLNCGKAQRERIVKLISLHSLPLPADRLKLKKLLAKHGGEFMLRLIEVKLADNSAKRPDIAAQRISYFNGIKAELLDILSERPPLTLSQLAVSGDDLIALGMAPGPEMGGLLRRMLKLVVEEELPNSRAELLKFAESNMPPPVDSPD